jgi:hypothetical protein
MDDETKKAARFFAALIIYFDSKQRYRFTAVRI